MGLIKSTFHFAGGALVGIYVAQNYNVPQVTGLVNTGLAIAKHFEEQYRKPSNSKPEDKP
ncbi:uncharacterized protein [Physcomitrium patens]|uniref:Uncharacterized protein n=1 Tax=Physcomitrium patens TaxID=3218 RepID=A9SRC7_PHYPA|nr:uncharacterized protein LOC112290187 [Physcomitrium patens]XP_024391990.1 uncharacterized protein LOC112290187 [Physcomitrium patens]PNR42045.1 hypothetical protein PHYPA_016874 [Physcomitrium patens]|eukprot:XP_024391989.1 uncharacterized protein LOC112290187 [Physcomitrella patens]